MNNKEAYTAPFVWVEIETNELKKYNLIGRTVAMYIPGDVVLIKSIDIAYDIENGLPFPTEANPALSTTGYTLNGFFIVESVGPKGIKKYRLVEKFNRDDV